MAHYTLDVDDEQLRAAGQGLLELGRHLSDRGLQARDDIPSIGPGQWSGTARDTIETEAQGLARELARFSAMFDRAGQALTGLAAKVSTAVTVDLPALNNRWDAAQDTFTDAVTKADQTRADTLDELSRSSSIPPQIKAAERADIERGRSQAVADAHAELTGTLRSINTDYDDLVAGLQREFRAASETLADNCVVAVPDAVVRRFIDRHATGAVGPWAYPDGSPAFVAADGPLLPDQLGVVHALQGNLALLDQRYQVLDGQRVSKYLDDWYRDGSRPPQGLPTEVTALLALHRNDPYFGQTIATTLGPQEIVGLMQKAKGLTANGEPAYQIDDYPAELARLHGLQDTIAGTLSAAVAAGSRAPGGLPGYAGTIIEQDPRTAGYLFKYADAQGLAFGGAFLHEAGTALVDREAQDPLIWSAMYSGDLYGFGSTPDLDRDKDPTLWFLRAADNSVEGAQAVLGDRDLLTYFLTQQPDFTGRGDATGDLLRAATVRAALDPGPTGTDPQDSPAWRAAQISSEAIHAAGVDGTPLPGTRTALGDILATYMPDVDRAFRDSDDGQGAFVRDYLDDVVGVRKADGWPQFGIHLDSDDLRDVLGDVAADRTAMEHISQSATLLNQLRLDLGVTMPDAPGGHKSFFEIAAQDSTQLQGFLVDAMARGRIEGAENEEERRKLIATAFLLPVALTSNAVGTTAPVVDFLTGNVINGAAGHFAGDAVDLAYSEANSDWTRIRDQLKLQVIIAGHRAGLDVHWPVDPATGQPKALAKMDEDDFRLLSQSMVGAGGPVGEAIDAVEIGQDNYMNKFTK